MEPKITTNPYTLKASEFAALFITEIFRKAWFIFLPFFGIIIGKCIYDIIREPSVSSLISFGIVTVLFFYVRYRFISILKKNPIMDRSRIVRIYEHCLELAADKGIKTEFFYVDIASISSLSKHFRVRVKTKQTFWFPKNCFRTDQDRLEFESLMKEKGKMK